MEYKNYLKLIPRLYFFLIIFNQLIVSLGLNYRILFYQFRLVLVTLPEEFESFFLAFSQLDSQPYFVKIICFSYLSLFFKIEFWDKIVIKYFYFYRFLCARVTSTDFNVSTPASIKQRLCYPAFCWIVQMTVLRKQEFEIQNIEHHFL